MRAHAGCVTSVLEVAGTVAQLDVVAAGLPEFLVPAPAVARQHLGGGDYVDTRVLHEEHKGNVTIADLQGEIARMHAAGARCWQQARAGQSLCSGG